MRSLFTTLILIAIGLSIIAASVIRSPLRKLAQKSYRVEVNPYSMVFYAKDQGQMLFKISPLDDYYYFSSGREHIVNDSNALYQTLDLVQEFLIILKRITIGDKSIVWTAKIGETTLVYKAEDKGDGSILISREIKNPKSQVTAIGQIVDLCESCLLTNEYGLAYLTEDNLTQDKLDLIEKLKFTPLIIGNNQLPGISKLIVINSQGEKEVEILASDNQEVYFDEGWHVLNLKTQVSNGKSIKVSQIVRF